MRKLALTATGLAVLAAAAPIAGAAPALAYDIAVTSSKTELLAYNHETFTFEVTVRNPGTVAGSAGAVHAPKIKGLTLRASGAGWTCTEPEAWEFFCMSQENIPHGGSLPPITVSGVPDGTTSHTFIPVTVDGWRRSEQNHANNVVNVLVTSYEH
ncbi:hypothetical protein M8C13_12340 [Crossiella sp. SN42]|uniref:hypothetical protein n=1 Tax=Crossiella sp. SN42 TaxID=2944808 RepID=UPI00207CE71D|nr:hypothetical protein [Crossiella sp. SN42]MCO1576540.1 hypothetical protein [Crossiella sp. SN42]